MSSDAQLVSVERAVGLEEYEAPAETAAEAENPLLRIHALMRGRYLAAALLAIVLGAGLGTGGFLLGRKLYVSTGGIRVSPVREVVDKTGASSAFPNYESFLDTQMALLQSEAVRDIAMAALGKPTTDASVQRFVNSLAVHKKGEIISIDFVDEDPIVAMQSVKALVTAYDGKQREEERKVGERRIEVLTEAVNSTKRKLQLPEDRIRELTTKYRGADLGQLCTARKTAFDELETQLQDTNAAIAAGTAPKQSIKDPSAALLRDLTPEEAARHDSHIAKLVQQRDLWEDDLQDKRRTLSDGHPLVKKALKALTETNDELSKKVIGFNVEFKQKQLDGTQDLSLPDAEARRALLDSLKARKDKLEKWKQLADSELSAMVLDRLEMDVHKDEVSRLKADLERFVDNINQANLEGKAPGVVSPFSFGDRPLQPLKDTRITFGAAGGLGGVMIGLGIVLLWGFSDRRFRNSDDARLSISGSQLLGILPALPETLDDSMQASLASYSVHHIRIMLQVWDRPRRRQTFAVTSPVAGTGKTSLALALGASFAASGSRTLLLDCDVIGGGLTGRVNAFVKRKIGRILVENKLVTVKQLDRALEISNRDSTRLGETLVGMGYLELEDLESALRDQTEVGLGLVDALKGEDIMNCITPTDVENLWVLPLGTTDERHVPMLSPAAAKALIAAAREQFDTVLVDTGPAPASLEAGAVAAAVDGVVLTVSRGEQRPLAEQCVTYLQSVGARVVGFVFNRASSQDVERHSGGRSSGWSSRTSKASPRGRMALGSERAVPTASLQEAAASDK
jgi:succinoglycan biosynthesis transport protein ExoP